MFNAVKKFRKLMKDKFWRAKQNYVKYYEELPIDEKAILLESEHGKKVNGNIFYLVRYLATSEEYKDYKIYVSSMGRYIKIFQAFFEEHGIKNVSIVMLASEEYFRLLASAKYLINDTSFGPYFIKKEGQIYLNTWHGTPLKTLGKSDISEYLWLGNIQKNFICSDYLLYPNEYMRDIMLRDYMLENVSSGKIVLSGYPRNEIFYDTESCERVRAEQELHNKRVYVYMPTYRGGVGKGKTSKSTAYLTYYLYELEKNLKEDEILYVNLHPLAKDGINFNEFKKIKTFPKGYEVYEFLNAADVLITDYSSVFFDFAVTGKKIVLFTYDEEEYLATRGMYMDIAELPFPHVYDVNELLLELRCEKSYCDTEFLNTFCAYECPDASKKLCDAVILGKTEEVKLEPIPDNKKETVLIYTGNLSGNGITVSLKSLLETIDLEKRNYILTFKAEAISKYRKVLKEFPEKINYIASNGDFNVTIKDRIIRRLFKKKHISASRYMKKCGHRVALAFKQHYGSARIDSVIQFNGYESETILEFSTFPGKKTIFVHNNMIEEIRAKGNQRKDVLKYAYNHYDNIAAVTEDMIKSIRTISGRDDNIKVVKNTINYKKIIEKSSLDFEETPYSKCSVSKEAFLSAVNSNAKKFINIGRFDPQKAQDRLIRAFAKIHSQDENSYLFIVGGYSLVGTYEKLSKLIEELKLENKIILIVNMPNPYNLLARCDYFILSSLHEGFGLVLAEADILGKPVISTDIDGPRTFMQKHGGTLVENSEDGILDGMRLLAEGKIKPMNVDYEKYNDEVRAQFDSLFS